MDKPLRVIVFFSSNGCDSGWGTLNRCPMDAYAIPEDWDSDKIKKFCDKYAVFEPHQLRVYNAADY